MTVKKYTQAQKDEAHDRGWERGIDQALGGLRNLVNENAELLHLGDGTCFDQYRRDLVRRLGTLTDAYESVESQR